MRGGPCDGSARVGRKTGTGGGLAQSQHGTRARRSLRSDSIRGGRRVTSGNGTGETTISGGITDWSGFSRVGGENGRDREGE